MSQENSKTIIILLNMGGPSSLEEVEPFLLNLFNDPDILDIPGGCLFRSFLARRIVRRRAPGARRIYAEMGGKSPILEITKAQAIALEEALRDKALVRVAMRYTSPDIASSLQDISSEDRLVFLPLYPQYSKSTTGSAFNEIHRTLKKRHLSPSNFIWVYDYHDHPAYINAWVSAIEKVVAEIPPNLSHKEVPILFSAHGVPCKLIEKGDPYESQIRRSMALIWEQGGWKRAYHLSYQSKVGRIPWLQPRTDEMLHAIARDGAKGVVLVPISFVSEHSETLYEEDILLRKVALDAGIEHYYRVPALNTMPEFISCLKEVVEQACSKSWKG